MTIVYDHSCLVTVVKNTAGARKTFGFLPPHGKELDANEEINILGSLTEAVNRGDRFGNRSMNALLDALDNGLISIVSTPAPILFDPTLDASKVVGIDNGSVVLSDPCWESSVSS